MEPGLPDFPARVIDLRCSGILFPVPDEVATLMPKSAPRDIPVPKAPANSPVERGSPDLPGRITGGQRTRTLIPASITITSGFERRKKESPEPHPPFTTSPRQLATSPRGENLGKTRSEDKEKERVPKSNTTQGLVRGGSDGKVSTNYRPLAQSPGRIPSPQIQRGFTPISIDNRTNKEERGTPEGGDSSVSPPRRIAPINFEKRRGSNDKGIPVGTQLPLGKNTSSTNLNGGSPKSSSPIQNSSPLRSFGKIVSAVTNSFDPFKRGSLHVSLSDEDDNFIALQNLGSFQPCDISHDVLSIIGDIDKTDSSKKTIQDFDNEFYSILEKTFNYVPLQQSNKLELINRWLSQHVFCDQHKFFTLVDSLKCTATAKHIQHRLEKILKGIYSINLNDPSKKSIPTIDEIFCSEEFKYDPFSLVEFLCKQKNQFLMRVIAKMVGGASLLGRYYLVYKYNQIALDVSQLDKKVLGFCKQDVKEIDKISWYEVVRQLMPAGDNPVLNFKIDNIPLQFKNPNREEDVNRFEYLRTLFTRLNSFLDLNGDANLLAFRLTHEFKHRREWALKLDEDIQIQEGSKIKKKNVTPVWKLVEMLKNDLRSKFELLSKIITSNLIPNKQIRIIQSILSDILCNWGELKECLLRLKEHAINNKEFHLRIENFEKFKVEIVSLSSVGLIVQALDDLKVPRELYSRVKYRGSFLKRFEPRFFSYPLVLKTTHMILLINVRTSLIPQIWPDLLPSFPEGTHEVPSSSSRRTSELVIEMNKSTMLEMSKKYGEKDECEIIKRNGQIVTIKRTCALITYYPDPNEQVVVATIPLRYETVYKSNRDKPYYKSKLFIEGIDMNEKLMSTSEGHRIRLQLIEKFIKPISSPRSLEGSPQRT